MAKKQKLQEKSSKNIVIFTLAILAVAAISFGVIVLVKQIQSDKSKEASKPQESGNVLQTEEDLKDEEKVAAASNDAKDRFEADQEKKTEVEHNESGLKVAKPVINFVADGDDKVEVGGDIPNINELEGTCTYEFTKGDSVITISKGILPNPSYISCEAASIEKTKLSSGTWNIKIKYKSNTSEGESEAQTYTAK